MIKKLISTKNKLDSLGLSHEANEINFLIKKISNNRKNASIYEEYDDNIEDIEWWKKWANYLSWVPVLGVGGSAFNLTVAIQQRDWQSAGVNLVTLILNFLVLGKIATMLTKGVPVAGAPAASNQLLKYVSNQTLTSEALAQVWNVSTLYINQEIEKIKKISKDPRITLIADSMVNAIKNPQVRDNFLQKVKEQTGKA